jgi:Domain of unknown function (DUF4278)
MQLSYRGTAYEAQNPAIEVTETNQLGLFLGNRFRVKQISSNQRHSVTTPLKYRGVDYLK